MTKRESLTESMRRLSDIVNEAEQVNEIDILRNPRDAIKGAAKELGSRVGTELGKRFKGGQASKTANYYSSSSRRCNGISAC